MRHSPDESTEHVFRSTALRPEQVVRSDSSIRKALRESMGWGIKKSLLRQQSGGGGRGLWLCGLSDHFVARHGLLKSEIESVADELMSDRDLLDEGDLP